jgi:hypothetical protein
MPEYWVQTLSRDTHFFRLALFNSFFMTAGSRGLSNSNAQRRSSDTLSKGGNAGISNRLCASKSMPPHLIHAP